MLSEIIPTYDYKYFDQYNQLQTKKLNIFQCIFRKIFGCYKETHLANVVKRTYSNTLYGRFPVTDIERQSLLKLIAKVAKTYGISQSYIPLGEEEELLSGTKVHISTCYNVGELQQDTDSFAIDSINLKIQFTRYREPPVSHKVSIFKNRGGHLVVRLQPDLFHISPGEKESEASIQSRLKSEKLQTINKLIVKCLIDSSSAPEVTKFRCYTTNYQHVSRHDISDDSNYEDLNTAQEDEMKQLGWKYVGEFETKQIYLLERQAASQQYDTGFPGHASIAFAVQSLKLQARDY